MNRRQVMVFFLVIGGMLLLFHRWWKREAPVVASAVAVPPDPAPTSFSGKAKAARSLFFSGRASTAPAVAASWDFPVPEEAWTGLKNAFPALEYKRQDETINEFCERVPDADMVAYHEGESILIGRLERKEVEDGTPSCAEDTLLILEVVETSTDTLETYVMTSWQDSDVRDGEGRSVPMFSADLSAEDLDEALASAVAWQDALAFGRDSEFSSVDDPELKRWLIQAHMRAFDEILSAGEWNFIQLRPDVRASLEAESAVLQERMFDAELYPEAEGE